MFAPLVSRVEMVVTFLALLELVRLKLLRVVQPAPFEEVIIFQKDGSMGVGPPAVPEGA